MRTKLIYNDINLFLSQEPDDFLKVIKKRIKTWQTATDSNGNNFLTFILRTVSKTPSISSPNILWTDIFKKLEVLNFEFKTSHYLPSIDLGTTYNPDMCAHYIALIEQLVERKITFDEIFAVNFVQRQVEGVDESVAVLLQRLSPIFEEIILKQKVKRTITFLVTEAYEMMLLETPSKETQIENNTINFLMNSFMSFGGQSLQSEVDQYLLEQSTKIEFILDYINTTTLSKTEAKELLLCFSPCGEIMQNLDRLNKKNSGTHCFEYMDLVRCGNLIPRHYFTKQQLDVMDKIQDKFSIQVLK